MINRGHRRFFLNVFTINTMSPLGRLQIAYDDYETYTPLSILNGLNDGIGWGGSYTSRGSYLSVKAFDTYETYTPLSILNGVNDGNGSWIGSYVSH